MFYIIKTGRLQLHFVQFYTFSTVSTVCVTGAGAGVDSAWEPRKLEARKMLENAAESPASSARGVSPVLAITQFYLN